jgi:hypothetical protein
MHLVSREGIGKVFLTQRLVVMAYRWRGGGRKGWLRRWLGGITFEAVLRRVGTPAGMQLRAALAEGRSTVEIAPA